MADYNEVYNGMMRKGNGYANAHISYKGRSVIVDYEFCLHNYGFLKADDNEYVPFEMYPYGDGDIYMGNVPLDKEFKKADIVKLIELLDKALDNEPAPSEMDFDWDEFEK